MKAVLIPCNEKYVPYSLVSLAAFCRYNEGYDKFIIGSKFSPATHQLAQRFGTTLLEVDLKDDFINIDKRPSGQQYPIECFYHFYAYKMLKEYDYVISIEADVYANKKLDLDLSSVKYIAGSFGHRKASVFLGRHLSKIREFAPRLFPEQDSISPGFKIYNIKGLEEIGFYEKVIQYYVESWKVGAPRCGDDSLTVLYQMIHPEHIELLEPSYNYISTSVHIDDYTELVNVHCIDAKWWTGQASQITITRYFNEKFVEFAYNNFPLEFIRTYLPDIYQDIVMMPRVKFYYYSGQVNFGDLITPYFLEKFCKPTDYELELKGGTAAKVISCGSIMRLCNSKTVVYGSGIRNIDQDIQGGIIKVVRGPLTRKRLLEIECPCDPVYGDPGLLLPLYYHPEIKKQYKLGIVPHHTQYQGVKELYGNEDGVLVINLEDKSVEHVIDLMLSCDKIVSSGLHGLIVSDAYGIPNKWIQFDNTIVGDGTKFHDYFQSVNRIDVSCIDAVRYKKISVDKLLAQIQSVSISFDKERLKDVMFFDEKGIRNYTKYLIKKLR